VLDKLLMIEDNKYLELTDTLKHVTILYSDISEFTTLCSKVAPSVVVYMLKELFTKFDQICLKHNVYKLYTIGLIIFIYK